jgi:hypothetical protein
MRSPADWILDAASEVIGFDSAFDDWTEDCFELCFARQQEESERDDELENDAVTKS